MRRRLPALLASAWLVAGLLSATVIAPAGAAPANRITRPYTITIKHRHHLPETWACHTFNVRRGTLTGTRCVPVIAPRLASAWPAVTPAIGQCEPGFDVCILHHPQMRVHFPPPPLLALMEASIPITSGAQHPRTFLMILAFFKAPYAFDGSHKFHQVAGCARAEPGGLAGRCQWHLGDLPGANHTKRWMGYVDCSRGRWYERWSASGIDHGGTMRKDTYYWPNLNWNVNGGPGNINKPPTFSQAFRFQDCSGSGGG